LLSDADTRKVLKVLGRKATCYSARVENVRLFFCIFSVNDIQPGLFFFLKGFITIVYDPQSSLQFHLLKFFLDHLLCAVLLEVLKLAKTAILFIENKGSIEGLIGSILAEFLSDKSQKRLI
jgi:hypothetical protein